MTTDCYIKFLKEDINFPGLPLEALGLWARMKAASDNKYCDLKYLTSSCGISIQELKPVLEYLNDFGYISVDITNMECKKTLDINVHPIRRVAEWENEDSDAIFMVAEDD